MDERLVQKKEREGRSRRPDLALIPQGGINGALANSTAMLNSHVASDRLPWNKGAKWCTCSWRGKAKGQDKSSVREEPT